MEEISNRKVVLLIEDDQALNRAAMFKLEQKGYKVISVLRAEDALEAIKTEGKIIDIIWLDLLLPGMSGMEFLSQIRSQNDYRNLKVVICSVSVEEQKDRARELGIADYLVKSDYEIGTLVEKVVSYA